MKMGQKLCMKRNSLGEIRGSKRKGERLEKQNEEVQHKSFMEAAEHRMAEKQYFWR